MGRFRSKASVMKFLKADFALDWRIELHEDKTASSYTVGSDSIMTDILSYVQPTGQRWIYGCGFALKTSSTDTSEEKYATIFKFNENGQVQYIYQFGDGGTSQPDNCRAINYDYNNHQIVMMVESTSQNLRPHYDRYSTWSLNASDINIFIMQDSGNFLKGYNINFEKAAVPMHVGDNSMFVHGNHYVFGGYSWGYKTRFQNETYTPSAPTYDTYLFKLDPTQIDRCFFNAEFSGSQLNQLKRSYDVEKYVTLTRGETLLFERVNEGFQTYTTDFIGSFPLKDSLKYPRMCASTSINMTGGNDTGGGVQYYRGQNKVYYDVGMFSNASTAVGQMDQGPYWIFQNGTEANGDIGLFT